MLDYFSSIWSSYSILYDNVFIIIKKHVKFVFIDQFIYFVVVEKRFYIDRCITFIFLNSQMINEWLNFNKNFYKIFFFSLIIKFVVIRLRTYASAFSVSNQNFINNLTFWNMTRIWFSFVLMSRSITLFWKKL